MGTRPGYIKQEIPVTLARPRRVEAPETALIAQQILTHLQDEIAKIVQEESDYAAKERAASGSGDPGRVLYPHTNTMGDGI